MDGRTDPNYRKASLLTSLTTYAKGNKSVNNSIVSNFLFSTKDNLFHGCIGEHPQKLKKF